MLTNFMCPLILLLTGPVTRLKSFRRNVENRVESAGLRDAATPCCWKRWKLKKNVRVFLLNLALHEDDVVI